MANNNHNQTKITVSISNDTKAVPVEKDLREKKMPKEKSNQVIPESEKNYSSKKDLKDLMMSSSESDSSGSDEDSEMMIMELNRQIKEQKQEMKVFRKHHEVLKSKVTLLEESLKEKDGLLKGMKGGFDSRESVMFSVGEGLDRVKEFSLMDLVTDLQMAKCIINHQKSDFLSKNSLMIQNMYDQSAIDKVKKHMNINSAMNFSGCKCSKCIQEKMLEVAKKKSNTMMSLTFLQGADLVLEYNTSEFSFNLAEDPIDNKIITLKDVKFKREPIKLHMTHKQNSKINHQSLTSNINVILDSKNLSGKFPVSLQAILTINHIREWVDNLDTMSNFQEFRVEELETVSRLDCFTRFYCEVMGMTEIHPESVENRNFSSINDLTFEEEVILMSKIWNKVVFVRMNRDNLTDTRNHISLQEFEGATEIYGFQLTNPSIRKTRFYTSDLNKPQDNSMRINQDFREIEILDKVKENEEDIQDWMDMGGGSGKSVMDKLHIPKGNKEKEDRDLGSWIEKDKEHLQDKIWPMAEIPEGNPNLPELGPYMTDEDSNHLSMMNMLSSDRIKEWHKVRMLTQDFFFSNPYSYSHSGGNFVRDAVKSNMSNKGMSSKMLDHWSDNRGVNKAFCINKADYKTSILRMLTLSWEEFVMIAFFWVNLKDFSNTVMYSDISKLLEVQTKMPKYFNMLLRKKVLLDTEKLGWSQNMDKFYRVISSSSFVKRNTKEIRMLYHFFRLRLNMGIEMQVKMKAFQEDLNESSWQDVSECNTINLNCEGNRNSWHMMFRDKIEKLNIRPINSFAPSMLDQVQPVESEIYYISKTNKFLDDDENLTLFSSIVAMENLWRSDSKKLD